MPATKRVRGRAAGSLSIYVFISYASEDRPVAKRLYKRLLSEPLLKDHNSAVWMDRPEIDPGDQWKKIIDKALYRSRIVLALLTPRSVDPGRYWIRYEQNEARRLFRRVVPILLEDCELPEHLADLHYVDFRDDWDEGFVELRNAVGEFAPRLGPSGGTKFVDATPPLSRPFVGREDDLKSAFRLIDGDSRNVPTGRAAVAIQGMGGSGKTMLAHELVRRIAVHYPGGVAVEARGQSPASAEAVLQKWAKYMLGRYPRPQWTVVDVRSHLKERYGEVLVLVDDVPAEDVDHVKQILDALPPDATRLVTTRLADIGTDLGCLVHRLSDFDGRDAIAFLRHRLQGKGPEPPLATLERLVACVGGHPLSLELVAANCSSTTELEEDIDDLRESLEEGELEEIALDIPELRKNASLAICLRDSLESLARQAKKGPVWVRRFAALGVFPDGAFQDATMIGAVWGVESRREVKSTLRALGNRALITLDVTSGLYQNHPILRAYAYGHLKKDPEELRSVLERYARFVIDIAADGFRAPPEEWLALEPFRPHIHRIGTMLKAAAERRLGPLDAAAQPRPAESLRAREDDRTALTLALDFAAAVLRYVLARPEIGPIGRDCLHLGLACARALGERLPEARYLAALGRWHQKSEPDLAASYLDSAIDLAGSLGDRALEAEFLTHRGELHRSTTRPKDALEVLGRALAIHRELGDDDMVASTLKSMGETHWRLGAHKTALEHHLEAMEIFVRSGNLGGQGDMLNKIGSVRFNEGRHRDAIEHFEKALEIHRRVGNRSMEAEDLNDMAIAYKYLDEVWRSLPALIEALEIHRDTGGRRLQAITMCNMANVYLTLGLREPAIALAEDALAIATQVKDRVTESWALSWKGQSLLAEGRAAEAVPLFERAVERAREAENPRGVAGHLASLGLARRELGHRDEALRSFRESVTVMRKHDLTQAFGGRTLEELVALAESDESEASPGPAGASVDERAAR